MSEHERLFGTKTGRHTHPVTHPAWLEFKDGECIVCSSNEHGPVNTVRLAGRGHVFGASECAAQGHSPADHIDPSEVA
jgi:hypothetical protein